MGPERVVLRDGSDVLIRQIHHADASLLADGFARLSDESRRLRFLTTKSALSASELRYFTEVDHHDHEALGALDPVTGRGLGIARYIRLVEDPQVAEVAVAVANDWQGRGLGTELLRRVADRARQEGICRFTALVAAHNPGVVGMLSGIGAGVRVIHREFDTVEYEIELAPSGGDDELQAVLRACGSQQLTPPKPIRDVLAALATNWFAADDE